jgi:sortase (surface protein transpeptidase)
MRLRTDILRYAAIALFTMGVTLFAVLFFWAGNDDTPAEPEPFGFDARTPIPDEPETATPSPSPIPTATNEPTATPTPTPFNGKISRLAIPALKIDYAIEEIGVKPNNELDTPHDANGKIGWYFPYDKPGFGGNALFSAHIYYNKARGPFWDLAKSKPGDVIIVTMEDGTEYRYKVIKGERIPVEEIKMGDVIWPPDRLPHVEWITLITCGGRLGPLDEQGFGEYLDRDIVVAERIT